MHRRLRGAGRPRDGRLPLRAPRPYAGRPLTAGRAILSLGAADRQLGDLARLLDRPRDAAAHYEAAIRLNDAMGLAPWAVHAQLGLAAALAARGEPSRALRDEALAGAAALGLTGLLPTRARRPRAP